MNKTVKKYRTPTKMNKNNNGITILNSTLHTNPSIFVGLNP
jgi:hypothetical protein